MSHLLNDDEVERELSKWPIGLDGAIRTGATAQLGKTINEIEGIMDSVGYREIESKIVSWLKVAKKEIE